MNNLINIENMVTNIALLAVFKNFLNDDTGLKFLILLEAINNNEDFTKVVELYSDFISSLYCSNSRGDWSSYVKDFVLSDENVVSKNCAKQEISKIPTFILGAFEFELRILSDIASIKFEDIKEILAERYPSSKDVINSLPVFNSYKLLFTKDRIQSEYKTKGFGIISKYSTFKYNTDFELIPVLNPDNVSFSDLKLYDYQKDTLKNNTIAFLKNMPANNVLLYGDRGCGKSSLVKACANEYRNLGLKIVQIYKENLLKIEDLITYLADFPSKFIIFIDDLVFDENDPLFSSCKAVLEGSLSAISKNAVIYVTTNRRHLVKETFAAREGNEIHMNDTMDEAVSLSDRFGITITFSSPDKNNYLKIVQQLADEANIEYDQTKLFREAEAFALLKGNRAPRVARQFLTDYVASNFKS